jgi:hypothetical protein
VESVYRERTKGRIIVIVIVIFIVTTVSTNFASYIGYNYIKPDNLAYAHFVGSNKTVDNYKVVFQLIPSVPSVDENSTLNFSVLDKNNANVNNVFAALIIKEKDTDKIVSQIPYKFYEFSDITFPPSKFQNNGKYLATLEARIAGDVKYEAKPLVANFDFSVVNKPLISLTTLIYYILIPTIVIIAGIAEYLLFFRKHKTMKNARKE